MATIQIADDDARKQYTQAVTANTTQLTIDFPFFSLDDIEVIVTSAAGVDTPLTRGTGTNTFAVVGTSVDDGFSGGYITLGDTYTDAATKFTIFRDIPVARTTDFPTSGPFNISALNTELDKLFAIEQELETKIGRTMKLAESDDAATLSLPNKDTRKGTVLAFNATSGLPEAGPKIGDVSSIAAITADIATLADIEDGTDATDAIQSVAGIASDVTAVAAKASLITSDFVSDLNTLAVTDVINDINTLATSDIVADLNILATSDVVADLAILATSDIVSDLNTLATSDIVSDINTLATSDIVSDLNTLATADIVSDLNTLATSDIVNDINTLATSDIVTDLNLLATSDFVSDLNTMATTANVNNLSAVAGKVTEIGLLGTSDAVADLAILGTSDAVSDMNALAAISSDITTVADNIGTISTKANAGANTDITSIKNTSLAIGRDDDNLIKFGTDNQIVFEVSGGDGVTFKASGEIEATSLDISGDADIDGTLEADAITVNGTALNTVIADEATALAIALG